MVEQFNPPIAIEDTKRKTKDVDYELAVAVAQLAVVAIKDRKFEIALEFIKSCEKRLKMLAKFESLGMKSPAEAGLNRVTF